MKVDINKVAETLKKNHADPALIRRTIEELNLAAQPEPGEEKAPPVKKQFIVLRVPSETPQADGLGWVLQIEEEASPALAYDRIVAAANSFNNTKKGRSIPVTTIGEALENIPAKQFKSEDGAEVIVVKTKVPVAVLSIPTNQLPKG